jgi:hypothetical protein
MPARTRPTSEPLINLINNLSEEESSTCTIAPLRSKRVVLYGSKGEVLG